MFAPSSSDDDGASRDDCGAHLETLTRLACEAQTLVADLLFAADAQDATFQLDRHPERADALFDFEYLRRPSACDARLSASPALRRVDETCERAARTGSCGRYQRPSSPRTAHRSVSMPATSAAVNSRSPVASRRASSGRSSIVA